MERRTAMLVVVKVVVSTVLMIWILRGADLGSVMETMASASKPLVILAFSMFFVGYLLTASRWRLLLKAQSIDTKLGYLVRSFMVAMFFNNFLPSTVGGDAVRVYDSWRLGKSKSRALTVIFVDRLLGLLALILLAFGGSFFAHRLTDRIPALPVWIAIAALAALVLSYLIFFPPRRIVEWTRRVSLPVPAMLNRAVVKLANALELFRGRDDVLWRALLLSFALQINVVLHFYVIALALQLPVPWHAFVLIVPIATVTMMLPIAINGIGVREGAFAVLLAAYGIGSTQAVAFAWISYGFILLQGLLGGAVFALRKDGTNVAQT